MRKTIDSTVRIATMRASGTNTLIHDRVYHYARLVRADKPIGAALLLWPMLWTLWIVSDGKPDWKVLLVFVVGTFMMRSAGCAINDFADREIDGSVERSRNRPIVTGAVTPREAVMVAVVLSLISFLLVLTMNKLTIALSFVGVGLAFLYPFTKRFTYWPQLFLGLAFGWAVPMVSAAQTGTVQPLAWLFYFVAIIWALAYDTIYAMVDRTDDIKLGVKSTAILFADYDVVIVMALQCIVLLLVTFVAVTTGAGWVYMAGLLTASLVLFRQWQLIRTREASACFRAFLLNNHMGALLFLGLFLDYIGRYVSS